MSSLKRIVISEKKFIISNCGVILLAAGASTRLGNPKQLLSYKGKSLINHMATVIEETGLYPVIAVLGANASLIAAELKGKNVLTITNNNWQEGIASSIRSGIDVLQQKHPASDGAIIMVCDQPYITPSLIHELISAQKLSGKPMAACTYENTIGTPALFHESAFPELLLLKGDKGAGKILQQRPDEVATVSFSMGRFDIDTEDDYTALQQNDPG